MSETAPCPWCEDGGKPFLHKEHHPQFAYSVMCHTCGARGPHVKFTHDSGRKSYDEHVAPFKEEATRLWNERYQVEESDEGSSEDAEGLRAVG